MQEKPTTMSEAKILFGMNLIEQCFHIHSIAVKIKLNMRIENFLLNFWAHFSLKRHYLLQVLSVLC